MEYILYGVSYELFRDMHDYFMPDTVITSSVFNNDEKLYKLILSSHVSVSASFGTIRISLNDKWYDIAHNDIKGFVII